VAAPVGFQCPKCAGQGSPGPSGHRAAGGFAMRRERPAQPVVTWTIIGLCVVMYLVELLVGTQVIAVRLGLIPAVVAEGEFWRMITAAFIHAGLLHIAFNMLVLFMLGPTLERILGHMRLAILYLLAAAGGSVLSYALSAPFSLSVGASGAIFGLMGALIVAGRRLSFDIRQVVVLLVINLIIGFLPGGGIDWRAHIGGLVVGTAVAVVFVHAPRQHRALAQLTGCAVIVLALVMVTGWRTEQLQPQSQSPANVHLSTASQHLGRTTQL